MSRVCSGLAGFEESEDRQHPPVLGFALRQVELGQDAPDVFLDRALGGMRRRHPDVDDRQLRPGRTDQGEQSGLIPRLADDVEPGTVEQAGETFTQQDIVVGEHDPGCGPALWRRLRCD
jgi:hypothetical protein